MQKSRNTHLVIVRVVPVFMCCLMPKLPNLIGFNEPFFIAACGFARLVNRRLVSCQRAPILLLLHYKRGGGTTVTCDRGILESGDCSNCSQLSLGRSGLPVSRARNSKVR